MLSTDAPSFVPHPLVHERLQARRCLWSVLGDHNVEMQVAVAHVPESRHRHGCLTHALAHCGIENGVLHTLCTQMLWSAHRPLLPPWI